MGCATIVVTMQPVEAIIKQAIVQALQKLGVTEIAEEQVQLEHPKDPLHGDFATNVALTQFKQVQDTWKTPLAFAQALAQHIEGIDVTAEKPGFLNFWIPTELLLQNLTTIAEKKDQYGKRDQYTGKKVVVEYSSPNIAKPFTVGHLRSTIIGDAIANLLEATGWTVYRDNHLGDWGTQFGKQIYAMKTWGDEEAIEKSERPVKLLVDLYVKFHEEAGKNPELEEEGRKWFQKLEAGDKEARELWKKCVEWSLKEFATIYDELGVSFTENNGKGYGESFFEDKMGEIITELEKKEILKENQGAKLIFFPDDKYPPLMIIKKDGATLYATRDLATDKYRKEIHGDDIVIINEVGIEQSLYFKQLFETENMLGWFTPEQRIHIGHGHYRFKEGKMSTRKGNVIWLEDILEEAEKRAAALGKDGEGIQAKAIGIGAIKWNDLKRTPQQDILFDWDDILNMQGNSGPYLQYTYVRTQSVLSKSQANATHSAGEMSNVTLERAERDLLRLLMQYTEVVEEAAATFSPHILCTYLFTLAQSFNLFYQKHKIIESKEKDFRLLLTTGVGQVLKNGLHLLGITVPQRM